MNLHINLEPETSSPLHVPNIPFIPLGALNQGISLYDYDFNKIDQVDGRSSEYSFSNENSSNTLQPHFDYRNPDKLLENKSVITNSILIDTEKKFKKKNSLKPADKRVSFQMSPRESSSHRRSRSESKTLVTFKLELVVQEEKIDKCIDLIDENVRNSMTNIPLNSRLSLNIDSIIENIMKNNGKKVLSLDAVKAFECNRDYYDKLISDIKKKKVPFVDHIFMPTITSIFNSTKSSLIKTKKYTWDRIDKIYKKSNCVLFDNLDPNNFKLGELSNCYFLSALSALTEYPELVVRLFENQNFTPNYNCFFVKICQTGVWRYILIDDCIPVINNNPAFLQPRFVDKNVEVYGLLIEKAFAKIYGGYQNIEHGSAIETLQELTGAPIQTLPFDDFSVYSIVQEALQKNFIVIAGCGHQSNIQRRFESIGLLPQYAYTILELQEFEYQGRQEKLVKIRNPWGWLSNQWKGKWSNDWFGWTSELKEKLGPNKEAGIFFMEINDFQDYFSYASICKLHSDYYYTSTTFRHKHGAFSIRKFKVSKDGHCYLGLSQHDRRYFRNGNKGTYDYAFARILVGRKIDFDNIEKELEEGGNFTQKIHTKYIKKHDWGFEYEYIDGISGRVRDLNLELLLEKGEYYIFVCADWGESIFDLNLTYYGDNKITFERVDYNKNANIFDDVIGGYAFENIFPMDTVIVNNEYKTYKFFAKKEGLIIEGFENLTDKEINIVKDYKELHNIFQLLRNYGKITSKKNEICEIKISSERPSFICVKFTNMDKYNITGIDKSILKTYGFK